MPVFSEVPMLLAANVLRMLHTDTPTSASWDGPSRYSSRLSKMHIRWVSMLCPAFAEGDDKSHLG